LPGLWLVENDPLTQALLKAVEDPIGSQTEQNPAMHFARGILLDERGQYGEAIREFDEVIRLEPEHADAYDRRGSAHFKLGHIKESIQDFDHYLKLRPKEEPGHWRRALLTTSPVVSRREESNSQPTSR
jgi:tetratricopeptide (TPR) repeat protein